MDLSIFGFGAVELQFAFRDAIDSHEPFRKTGIVYSSRLPNVARTHAHRDAVGVLIRPRRRGDCQGFPSKTCVRPHFQAEIRRHSDVHLYLGVKT